MEKGKSLSVFARVLTVLLFAVLVVTGSNVPVPSQAADEEPLYMFNVIGDMQIGDPGCYYEKNYKAALEDIMKNSPETKAVVTVGDNTNNATVEEYELLDSVKTEILGSIPMYMAIGNHDRGYVPGTSPNNTKFKTVLDRFVQSAKANSGLDTIDNVYYSFQLNGSYFIVLGSEVTSRNDTCNDVYVSETQYNWFKAQMEEANKTDKPIFVMIHEPFLNTVSGSLTGQNWNGNPNKPDYYPDNFYDKLQAVADQYSKAVVFSGHTHWRFDSESPAIITNGKTASYFNCSAVGYIWLDGNKGIQDNTGKYTGSEGLYVYVYSDKIVVKGRDFVNQKWVLEKTVPLAAASNSDGNTNNDGNTNTNNDTFFTTTRIIIIACCAVAVIAVIVIIVVMSSKKSKKEQDHEK